MARLGLTLLGGFQARLDSGEALTLPTKKAQALLAYLALPLGQAHPRHKLAALLWGGIREESARASLRQALFGIRKALGGAEGPALRQEADTLALDPATVDVDVAALERAVSEGTPEALERAAVLYRGDLLAGLAVDEAPFEEWLVGERERLRELALEGLAKLLAHQRRSGATEAAVGTALRLVMLDSLQESVHRTLMRLYADLGRRGAALRQYQQCVSVLQRELGVEPEAETKALYQTILRERPQRTPTETTAERRELPRVIEHRAPGASAGAELVGRAAEMEQLHAALTAAIAGRGRVVSVIGEAGIGKSRLVAELAAAAARRGLAVLLGRSYESEQILPFGPWVDAMRAGRIAEDADLLARLGAAWRSELARLLPEVAEGRPPASAVSDNRQLFESVVLLLGELARRHPLLLVLEDLHWADEMSVRLIAFVGRRLAEWPALVVVTAREEELADAPALQQAFEDLRREGGLATLDLEPLVRADTLALVRALARTGDEAALGRLSEHAWALSEGNPFVVVETVRAHAEGAAPALGRGLGLPERVRDLVGRRLGRLSEGAQTLAAVAAVIGREFEFALLQRAAGVGEDEAAAGVEELVRRQVLHGLGERFDFTHDRIREVVFGRILGPRRKLLHRRVAEAMETVYAENLEPHALALGLHYQEAEVWDLAVTYLARAGRAARNRAANREAAACLERTLAAVDHLPDGPAKIEHAIETRVDLEWALMGLGEIRRGLERLREAETLARAAGDRRRLGRVYNRMTYDLAALGDFPGALAKGEAATALATEAQDLWTLLNVNTVVSRALYGVGEYRRAIEVAQRNEDIVRTLTSQARLADPSFEAARGVSFSRVFVVLAMAEVGRVSEGAALGEEAVAAAHRKLGPHEQVWARLGLGRLYALQGAFERAIDALEPAFPLCETSSDLAVYFSRAASSLGEAYARSGRISEGLALLERAASHAEATGFAYSHALVVAILGDVLLLAGERGEAVRRAAEALDLARRYGQRGWEAWALRLRGELAARREPLDLGAAETNFRGAVALAEERGMRPVLAHCRLGLGTAYARVGKEEPARQEIEAALAEYRAMEMPYWASRAASALTDA